MIPGVYEEDDEGGQEAPSPQGGESASLTSMPPLPPKLPAMSKGAPLFPVTQVYASPKDGTPQGRMGGGEKNKEPVARRFSPRRAKAAAGQVKNGLAKSLIEGLNKMDTSNK